MCHVIFQTMDNLLDQCVENNVTVISQQVFLYDPLTQVQKLKVITWPICTVFYLYFNYVLTSTMLSSLYQYLVI